MGIQERATKIIKLSDDTNALSSVIDEVSSNGGRILLEKNGHPVAAIVSVKDLKKLVYYERINRKQGAEDSFAALDEIREAFKDIPDEEIEWEADRAVAEIRGKLPVKREQQEPEDLWTIVDRMREAFKDVPPEEIEQETDRIIARIRSENRAAREATAKTG